MASSDFKTVDNYIKWRKRTNASNVYYYIRGEESAIKPEKGDVCILDSLGAYHGAAHFRVLNISKYKNGFMYLLGSGGEWKDKNPVYLYSDVPLETYNDIIWNIISIRTSRYDCAEFLGEEDVFDHFEVRKTGVFKILTEDSLDYNIFWEGKGKYIFVLDEILNQKDSWAAAWRALRLDSFE